MVKRVYRMSKKWEGTYGEVIYFDGKIEIDDIVIDAVDDDWRKTFYPSLTTPQKIAEHIAYNLIVNDATLTRLDGFANLSDDMVKILK